MRTAAAATLIYSLAVWTAAAAGWLVSPNWISLGAGALAGAALLACGLALLKGRMAGGFAACGVALVLGLYYGYGFVVGGSLAPGGAMLLVSFVALFFILIGLFAALAKASREEAPPSQADEAGKPAPRG